MAQITDGARSILSHPFIYSAFQSLMGAHKSRRKFVDDYVSPFPGINILDIDCGPGDVLSYLKDVEYWGYDISETYITQAREKFGDRGHFSCKRFQIEDTAALPKFDVVLDLGLLHHLDDAEAIGVLQLAYQALKPSGRLLTIDPCLDPSQNPIARLLVHNDRGQNVRDRMGYQTLSTKVFSSPRIDVIHQSWIPYTHCFMECQR